MGPRIQVGRLATAPTLAIVEALALGPRVGEALDEAPCARGRRGLADAAVAVPRPARRQPRRAQGLGGHVHAPPALGDPAAPGAADASVAEPAAAPRAGAGVDGVGLPMVVLHERRVTPGPRGPVATMGTRRGPAEDVAAGARLLPEERDISILDGVGIIVLWSHTTGTYFPPDHLKLKRSHDQESEPTCGSQELFMSTDPHVGPVTLQKFSRVH